MDILWLVVAFAIVLLSLTIHEAAHAWTADRLGDPTARLLGRVSLNPVVHIDPIGTILLPLLAAWSGLPIIGWAKPVPVNFGNLRDPKRDMLWVAAAGPAVNFAMALAWAVLFRFAVPGGMFDNASIVEMARIGVSVNLVLMALNLLPIPPLDGGRIMVSVLPPQPALALARLEPYGMMILVGLLVFDRELRIIHTFTSTFASNLSGTILSTAVGFSAGTSP